MGAIADSIMAYAKPLIETTDGSLEQLNKALTISQACWNLAILPEEERQSTLASLRTTVGMSESEFVDFQRVVLTPMIRRHEEMFPKLHPAERLESPHGPLEQSADTGDPDQLIRELDAACDRLPESTLRACQQHRELVIPRLIDVLQEAALLGQQGTIREGNAPLYAMMLLGEFQATEALPALCAFLSAPADVPYTLLGDAITEDLPRILAILSADVLDALDSLIRDMQINEYVRSSAARAVLYLVRDGLVERSHAIERLRKHLRAAITAEDCWGATFLVSDLADLNANEARAEIDDAFAKNIVDESYIDLDFVVERLLRPSEPDSTPELEKLRPTKIDDVVEEHRGWHWPTEKEIARREWQRRESSDLPFEDDEWSHEPGLTPDDGDDDVSHLYAPATIRHEAPRVGRNDPCPCGSGKKYKKCCLRTLQSE